MTTKIHINPNDEQALKDAVARFNERLEIERVLSIRLYKCVELIRQTLELITESVGHQLVSCESDQNMTAVAVQDRVLTLVPVTGFAADNRLHRPRGMYCCQILVYVHQIGHKEGRLISSFRVYADGLCSDGDQTWRLDTDTTVLSEFLIKLIVRNLIDCELLWPAQEALPDYINMVAVTENKIEPEALKHPCIGFECALPDRASSTLLLTPSTSD